ncbi:MAG: FAD-binding domain-containing protein [Pseudomonadota bacterium]
MERPITILWFKRDLRVADHPALASVEGPVVPLYIAEPEMWSHPDASARQWAFVAESLVELRGDLAGLGAPLVLRHGDAVQVLESIRQTVTVGRLVSHQETGLLWSWDRDKRVAAWCADHGIPWDELSDNGVVRRLASRDGWAAKRERFVRQPLAPKPVSLVGTDLDPGDIPTADLLGLAPDPCPQRQTGGRKAGLQTFDSFLHERGEGYRRDMSSPVAGETGCSRLSPHLAWGTLSVREVHQAAITRAAEMKGQRTGWPAAMSSFKSRLAWRDHFTQKLEDFPKLDRQPLHPAFADLHPPAAENKLQAERLSAWAEGRTGLPFVDACMRYAKATGWLNFRMRAMVQCVASYHFWIDWRDSAPVLARLWTDYAPGIHYAQAQMQSGVTGINQLRIYNPVKQGRDQDPSGAFTRRWVPEIAHLPDEALQEPWTVGGIAGYPPPIVDVAEAARQARARIIAVRRQPGFREEANRVVAKHGSRKGPNDRQPRRRRKDSAQSELPL